MLYLKLNDDKKDSNLFQMVQKIKTDIIDKLPGFDFEKYQTLVNTEKINYITSLIPGVVTRKLQNKIAAIASELEKYIHYWEIINNSMGIYVNINENDKDPPTYKNDFTVFSFRKLLEMNVITVGDNVLDGFDGINANEINVNIALLYFIENKIASMNKEPIPHPELIGLFSQLFKGSGIISQEYIKTNPQVIGGGGDDLFDTMNDLFMSDDPTMFNEYRKNSYLLLNMPTNYEISINNFQFYPFEIRLFLQGLNKEYTNKTKRDEQISQIGNIFSKKQKTDYLLDNTYNKKQKNYTMMDDNMMDDNFSKKRKLYNVNNMELPVYGGLKTKNNKTKKTKIRNKKTKTHNKKTKIRTVQKKTIKNKVKKMTKTKKTKK
jgi:hypothetical protein